MIKVENIEVYNIARAIYSARNPKNSWAKSDSDLKNDIIGENDLSLMRKLYRGGSEHRKYARQIFVSMDITAPLYWWKEMDTYKVGIVSDSCSTMHRLTPKPFEMTDFSFEHLIGKDEKIYFNPNYSDVKEVWRVIDEHPNYQISNLGNVYSTKQNKVLKACINSSNYKKYILNGKNVYAHRLVANAFIPNPNGFPEVNHKNGNKWDNCVDNLEWVTKSENALHAFKNGLRTIDGYTRYKVAQSTHKFSAQDIEDIKTLYEDGYTKKQIAEKYNCSDSIICNIINGNTYIQIDLTSYDVAKLTIDHLNQLRDLYIETEDKTYWWQIIQLLPTSYNQRRTITMNYENVFNIIHQRSHHKLDEWKEFVNILTNELPYVREIMGVDA